MEDHLLSVAIHQAEAQLHRLGQHRSHDHLYPSTVPVDDVHVAFAVDIQVDEAGVERRQSTRRGIGVLVERVLRRFTSDGSQMSGLGRDVDDAGPCGARGPPDIETAIRRVRHRADLAAEVREPRVVIRFLRRPVFAAGDDVRRLAVLDEDDRIDSLGRHDPPAGTRVGQYQLRSAGVLRRDQEPTVRQGFQPIEAGAPAPEHDTELLRRVAVAGVEPRFDHTVRANTTDPWDVWVEDDERPVGEDGHVPDVRQRRVQRVSSVTRSAQGTATGEPVDGRHRCTEVHHPDDGRLPEIEQLALLVERQPIRALNAGTERRTPIAGGTRRAGPGDRFARAVGRDPLDRRRLRRVDRAVGSDDRVGETGFVATDRPGVVQEAGRQGYRPIDRDQRARLWHHCRERRLRIGHAYSACRHDIRARGTTEHYRERDEPAGVRGRACRFEAHRR